MKLHMKLLSQKVAHYWWSVNAKVLPILSTDVSYLVGILWSLLNVQKYIICHAFIHSFNRLGMLYTSSSPNFPGYGCEPGALSLASWSQQYQEDQKCTPTQMRLTLPPPRVYRPFKVAQCRPSLTSATCGSMTTYPSASAEKCWANQK